MLTETVTELLTTLADRGVRLSASAGSLHCYAQPGMMTPELREAIALHKDRLVELLRNEETIAGPAAESTVSRNAFVGEQQGQSPMILDAHEGDVGELDRELDAIRERITKSGPQSASVGTSLESCVLVPINPDGPRLPLFVVPGAGGNVLSFHALSLALGAEQPFYGLEAIGLDGSPPLESVEATAAANLGVIRTVQPNGPYQLLGYSYGGIVAFEMARQLLLEGDEVACLLLLDTATPDVMRAHGLFDGDSQRQMLYRRMAALSGSMSAEAGEDLQQSSRDDFLDQLATMIGADRQQVETPYRVYMANMRCYEHYQPAMLPVPIVVRLYRATDTGVKEEGWPRDLGWGDRLARRPEVVDLNVDHFSTLQEPAVSVLAESMSDAIAGATSVFVQESFD